MVEVAKGAMLNVYTESQSLINAVPYQTTRHAPKWDPELCRDSALYDKAAISKFFTALNWGGRTKRYSIKVGSRLMPKRYITSFYTTRISD